MGSGEEYLLLAVEILAIAFTLVYAIIRGLIRPFVQKPKSLRGKVSIVTGSGGGLGRELCLELAKEGCVIACVDIDPADNQRTLAELKETGANAKGYLVNLASKKEVDSVVEEIRQDLGEIDLLVNSAGAILRGRSLCSEYVREVFHVNTIVPIWTIQAVLPGMTQRNSGHIVNISSTSALYGPSVQSIYAASKAALTNYSESLRLKLNSNAENQIQVTCAYPHLFSSSGDYPEMITTRMPAVSPGRVAKEIVHAVKYNKTDISCPWFLYWIFSFARFMPSEVIAQIMKLMDVRYNPGAEDAWRELEDAGTTVGKELEEPIMGEASEPADLVADGLGLDEVEADSNPAADQVCKLNDAVDGASENKLDTPPPSSPKIQLVDRINDAELLQMRDDSPPPFKISSLRESDEERMRRSIRTLRQLSRQPTTTGATGSQAEEEK